MEIKTSGGLRFSLLVEGADLHASLLATLGFVPDGRHWRCYFCECYCNKTRPKYDQCKRALRKRYERKKTYLL